MNKWQLADYIIGNLLIFSLGTFCGVYFQSNITSVWHQLNPSLASSDNQIQSISPNSLSIPDQATADHAIYLPHLDRPLPLIYSTSLEEPIIQKHLQRGAVVLPLGTSFGDIGNVVVTAHSSGPINPGKYRQAFAQLADLTVGEEFQIQTPTASYTYRVYDSEIVMPDEVNKLPSYDQRSTVTLVTCWPLESDKQRLLVHAELIDTQYNI